MVTRLCYERGIEKRKIESRLRNASRRDRGKPVFAVAKSKVERGSKLTVMSDGGIALVHRVVRELGLMKAIDERLNLLKRHAPYYESDHVMNIVYNALCGGACLEDLEERRNDIGYLDALGVDAIPDPTTARDFCRRFDIASIEALMDAINEVRVRVWARQSAAFLKTAYIDVDSTMVPTTGECKEGIGYSYNKIWGYHPLVVSLGNTNEPLYFVNRSANRTSAEGSPALIKKAVALCRRAGFQKIVVRGDTAFSLSSYFDEWDDDDVRFVIGFDAIPSLKLQAKERDVEFVPLMRKVRQRRATTRTKPTRHKRAYVHAHGYKCITTESEEIAEFEYSSRRAQNGYRMITIRKNLEIERGQGELLEDARYFFYVTNDKTLTPTNVVEQANKRCNQERIFAQLKGGVHALKAPLNTLNANWAYMVMVSLAWSIKVWMGLTLPVNQTFVRDHARARARWISMSFRRFVQRVIKLPAQVVRRGRQTLVRLLSWTSERPHMMRLYEAL